MHATLSATAVSRRRFETRLAVLFIAAGIGGAALGAMIFQTYSGPATISAAGASATAEAYSARLLAMDKQLFSAVDTSATVVAHRKPDLRDANDRYYPPESSSTDNVAARNRWLLDLNNIFYPPEAVSANAASALSVP